MLGQYSEERSHTMRKIAIMILALFFVAVLAPSNALEVKGESKSAFARGTVTGTSWAVDYPDFAHIALNNQISVFDFLFRNNSHLLQ